MKTSLCSWLLLLCVSDLVVSPADITHSSFWLCQVSRSWYEDRKSNILATYKPSSLLAWSSGFHFDLESYKIIGNQTYIILCCIIAIRFLLGTLLLPIHHIVSFSMYGTSLVYYQKGIFFGQLINIHIFSNYHHFDSYLTLHEIICITKEEYFPPNLFNLW